MPFLCTAALSIDLSRNLVQQKYAELNYTAPDSFSAALADRSDYWTRKNQFDAFHKRLSDLTSLPENWDAEDAARPTSVALDATRNALLAMQELGVMPERISPSVEGGVAVSFLRGRNRAFIEFYNSGEIVAATYEDEGEPVVWEVEAIDAMNRAALDRIHVHLTG